MIHFFVTVWTILKDSLIALPTWVHAHPWVLLVFVLVIGIVTGLMAFWPVIFAAHYEAPRMISALACDNRPCGDWTCPDCGTPEEAPKRIR